MKRKAEEEIEESNKSKSNFERQVEWVLSRIIIGIAHGALDFIRAGFYPNSSCSNSELDWPDGFTHPDAPPVMEGDDVLFISGGVEYQGTVKWRNQVMAGVEFQEPVGDCDGTINGSKYFDCKEKHGMFLPLSYLAHFKKPESAGMESPEVLDSSTSKNIQTTSDKVSIVRPVRLMPAVQGHIPPISVNDFGMTCGKAKGIQGNRNSCYMDAILFCIFAFTDVCDSSLSRSQTVNDIPRYKEVQRVLREEIINPLRQNFYVGAENVMKLRCLLDELSTVGGLTNEQKDPEEFLRALFGDVLREEPFLKFDSGQNDYFYQLFVTKIGNQNLVSIQILLERSFEESGVKLKEVPRVLILQMPRYGNEYKTYDFVIPNLELDISRILESSTPNRKPIIMELSAALCIKSVHYTSFAKCGRGDTERWCYFDSMSEVNSRYGATPEVTECPNMSSWLSDDAFQDDRMLPDYLHKLLRDVSLCIYRRPE